MSNIEEKVEVRLEKPFFNEMLVMAAVTGANYAKYCEEIKKWAVFIRKSLDERGLIKKLKYRPKEFWNFKGKKKVYNIDGGQVSLSVTGSATLGIRVGTYKVMPGDYSEAREDFDMGSTLTSNLIQDSHYEDDDDLEPDYKKMLQGSRMLMELAEVVKQSEGNGKWEDKPNSKDIIYLHGPILFQAAMYHMSATESPFPPYKKEFCDSVLTHQPNYITKNFKNPKKNNEHLKRSFIPIYCEIANYVKNSKIPTYGIIERSGTQSPGIVTRALIRELYRLKDKDFLEFREFDYSWKIKKAGSTTTGLELRDKILKKYPISDSHLFDLMLDEGEYVEPVQIIKQLYGKWPTYEPYIERIQKQMPEPFVTYLKVSEFKTPFRVETLSVMDQYENDMDLTFHSSKLLPQYAFPLGLDTVDKLAKVPQWMRHSLRQQYHMKMLRALIATGNKDYIKIGLKSLMPSRTGWNRPQGL